MGFKRVSLFVAPPLPSTGGSDQISFTQWFARALDAHRSSHERLFARYLEAYLDAEGLADELRSRRKSVAAGVTNPGDLTNELLEKRRLDVRLAAESLVLPLDAMLGDLRFRLFGTDVCKDDGPILRNGVTVDRALDAIGNYVRHESEWLSHDSKDTWPTKYQDRSIRPLAQLRTSRQIEGVDDAYEEFTMIELPSPFVLDLLGDYETAGPQMTYRAVETKVHEAAMKSIERRFAPPANP